MSQATAVLDRFLEPVRQFLTPDLARQLADFRADAEIQARVDELARKCNEGLLTASEQAEYEAIVEEADLIALLQAKARAFLADRES
jgi:hypothetical protein